MFPITSATAVEKPIAGVSRRTFTVGTMSEFGRGLDPSQGTPRRRALPSGRRRFACARDEPRRCARTARNGPEKAAESSGDSRSAAGSLLSRRGSLARTRPDASSRQSRRPGAHRAADCRRAGSQPFDRAFTNSLIPPTVSRSARPSPKPVDTVPNRSRGCLRSEGGRSHSDCRPRPVTRRSCRSRPGARGPVCPACSR